MAKKIPMRMCIGCGEMKPKKELIRAVKSPEGEISLDFTGKKSGRGAYLCQNAACLEKAQKGHKLEKSFSCKVAPEVYEVMMHALSEADGTA
ncbi:MAG: YlxR family protein [Oscillospiraceae bacterium]|nr:YlxR family protein [Oscillospiraceae bacterium]MBQ7013371.1 YlxR family protein [Oscillospiraceae bacterium]